jgi:hypothetical protein
MATSTIIKVISVVLPVKRNTNINTFDTDMQHVHDMLATATIFGIAAADLLQFQTDIPHWKPTKPMC